MFARVWQRWRNVNVDFSNRFFFFSQQLSGLWPFDFHTRKYLKPLDETIADARWKSASKRSGGRGGPASVSNEAPPIASANLSLIRLLQHRSCLHSATLWRRKRRARARRRVAAWWVATRSRFSIAGGGANASDVPRCAQKVAPNLRCEC